MPGIRNPYASSEDRSDQPSQSSQPVTGGTSTLVETLIAETVNVKAESATIDQKVTDARGGIEADWRFFNPEGNYPIADWTQSVSALEQRLQTVSADSNSADRGVQTALRSARTSVQTVKGRLQRLAQAKALVSRARAEGESPSTEEGMTLQLQAMASLWSV